MRDVIGRRRTAKTIVHLTAAISIFLGMVVLLGWHTHNKALIQINPSFVPMQYNTALGFLLAGLGVMAIGLNLLRGGILVGGALVLIGGVTLAQYIFGVNIGLDELFMKHEIEVGTSSSGRMAPNTALCFLLVGATLTSCAHFNSRDWIGAGVGVLGAIVVSLGTVAFFGYFAQLETAYGWGSLTRMAIHTALGFVIVGSGLLALALILKRRRNTFLPRSTPAIVGIFKN